MIDWINVILQGVLVGGLYAMFAAGLSLIFGVMRLVNIAHGDLIVLAAYVALVTTETLGVGPLISLAFVVPLMAVIGYALQRLVLNRTLGEDLLPPLLRSDRNKLLVCGETPALIRGTTRRHSGAERSEEPGIHNHDR
jgi:branched-chain amino acid transport system permease protein